jgi:hypothetical protein
MERQEGWLRNRVLAGQDERSSLAKWFERIANWRRISINKIADGALRCLGRELGRLLAAGLRGLLGVIDR